MSKNRVLKCTSFSSKCLKCIKYTCSLNPANHISPKCPNLICKQIWEKELVKMDNY